MSIYSSNIRFSISEYLLQQFKEDKDDGLGGCIQKTFNPLDEAIEKSFTEGVTNEKILGVCNG